MGLFLIRRQKLICNPSTKAVIPLCQGFQSSFFFNLELFIFFTLKLTSKALTVLCSIVKHAGSSWSTKCGGKQEPIVSIFQSVKNGKKEDLNTD